MNKKLKRTGKVKKRRTGKFEFLSLLPEISQQLNAGKTAVILWEQYTAEKKVTISYAQFTRYVSKYLKQWKMPNIRPMEPSREQMSIKPINRNTNSDIRAFRYSGRPGKTDDLI